MAFIRFACFLLVALPVTSLSIIKFHQEDKYVARAEDCYDSLGKELLRKNIIGGRRLGVKELMVLEDSKSLGSGFEEKVSKMDFSSYSNGEGDDNSKKKKKQKKISRLERKKVGSGSTVVVYNNADYLTHMHHPPKHN